MCHHLEKSIQNLWTDYRLYYLHRVNEQVPFKEVAEAMGRLIKKGAIHAWGMSQVDVGILARAHTITPDAVIQKFTPCWSVIVRKKHSLTVWNIISVSFHSPR